MQRNAHGSRKIYKFHFHCKHKYAAERKIVFCHGDSRLLYVLFRALSF